MHTEEVYLPKAKAVAPRYNIYINGALAGPFAQQQRLSFTRFAPYSFGYSFVVRRIQQMHMTDVGFDCMRVPLALSFGLIHRIQFLTILEAEFCLFLEQDS